jgi:ABC-type multidrug transport system ATPase subunit
MRSMSNVLEVRDLVKRYRNGTVANDHLTLDVREAEVYALLGPNGAGKTTLVGQLLGLKKPTSGSITLDGVDVVANPGFARRSIGFLPQSQTTMDRIHVDEFIEHVAMLRGMDRQQSRGRANALIEELQLQEFRHTSMMETSGGVRRLAGYAAAAVAPVRLLVLDEPTNDIDPIRRQLLWRSVDHQRAVGTTVLLVTHNLIEAERFIDRLAIIDQGRIVREGTPASLRSVVTDRLRLEVTIANGGYLPHPALTPEPGRSLQYLFDAADLDSVSTWLSGLRSRGVVVDFRIGPPTLEDIYAAAIGPGSVSERPKAGVA